MPGDGVNDHASLASKAIVKRVISWGDSQAGPEALTVMNREVGDDFPSGLLSWFHGNRPLTDESDDG